MRFLLFPLLMITVTALENESIQAGLEMLRSQIQVEKNEISEMLLNTMKDVSEASAVSVNDPIVTPPIKELNSYLETMKSSVEQPFLTTALKQVPPQTIPIFPPNCVTPGLVQSVDNVGNAQQLVATVLHNVSNTLGTIASNFNGMANYYATALPDPVINTVFSSVAAILGSVVDYTTNSLALVNNRIQSDFNTFSSITKNMSICHYGNLLSVPTAEITTVAAANPVTEKVNETLNSQPTTIQSGGLLNNTTPNTNASQTIN